MFNRLAFQRPISGRTLTSALLQLSLAAAVIFAISASAQTNGTSAPAGAAQAGSAATQANPLPSAPSSSTGGSAAAGGSANKIGAINITEAIFASNEGARDLDALGKKFEPKQAELKSQNDELEAMKKQFDTQKDKLNEEAAAKLKKDIESKQKTFDRSVQDAQEDFGNQRQEIATRILQKLAPVIVKYSQDNGFGVIVDTSNPWPQSPILWWNPDKVDITKPVIDLYNVQSGVPAPPASPASTKPAAPKAPSATTPKAPSSNQPK
jgi:outer membrane protein